MAKPTRETIRKRIATRRRNAAFRKRRLRDLMIKQLRFENRIEKAEAIVT